ncbi:MAG TPA: DUF3892 domain-containing protein [Bauldia sp.]|nr:DUF3892 domain-containing protein [Bauldia sp.]
MLQSLQVLSSTKDHRRDPYRTVTHIGGLNADGTPWRLSVAEAIEGVRALRWEFYLKDETGRRVWLHVTVSRDGHEYLKALDDPGVPRRLLALPSEIEDGPGEP